MIPINDIIIENKKLKLIINEAINELSEACECPYNYDLTKDVYADCYDCEKEDLRDEHAKNCWFWYLQEKAERRTK